MKTVTGFVLICFLNFMTLARAAEDMKLAEADNNFAFRLLREVAAQRPAQNIFISPYSAATALQMVAGGAVGLTKTEMEEVLGTTGVSNEAVGKENQGIAAS